MIAFTTGRESNQRLNSLVKELAHATPYAGTIRRGKSSREELATRLWEREFTRVAVLYRWHGAPGRMDFYTVDQSGLSPLPPGLILRNVRLSREYARRVKCVASSITQENSLGDQTNRLCDTLSNAFELPYLNPQSPNPARASFHVSSISDGGFRLAVTSPPGEQEVGPTLTISRLAWNSNEEVA